MKDIAAKIATGTFVIIGLGLIITNPNGTSTGLNSLSSAYNSGVKQLQAG